MQKRILSLIALTSLAAPLSSAATYFLPGVSESGGWHDAEKQWVDASGNKVDDMMCWAAQASCMAQYWQDWYVKAGNELPGGTPDGYGTSKRADGIVSSNIFETYKANWTNLGGLSEFGLPWYFTGQPDPEFFYNNYYRHPDFSKWNYQGGGYYSDLYATADDFINNSGYYQYEVTGGGTSIQELTEELMRLITVDFSVVGLSIQYWDPAPAGGHAVTLWGIDVDDVTGLVTAIYITDSDDDYHGLCRYELETEYGGADIKMQTYLDPELRDRYDVTIDEFTALSVAKFVAAIPEPSSFGLLAGVVALGACAYARRRRRC